MSDYNAWKPQDSGRDRGAIATLAAGIAPSQTVRPLRHETRLLPHVALDPRGPYGAACRARFDGRSLREAAEYVCDCDTAPGPSPDDFTAVLAHQTGTIGAKQALLAALAAEIGRKDVQLIVGCCEMQLPEKAPTRVESNVRSPHTLPLAVCWLRYRGRRLQIVEPTHASLRTLNLVTEMAVRPEHLAAERVRLYKAFAADWCRALEVYPTEFARLRARQLRLSAKTSLFEDLLGYALPSDYVPTL
jgi:hypothetical protein